MQVASSNPSNINSGAGIGGTGTPGSSGAQSFQSLLGQLNSYVDGTPSQQMEAEILGQLGLTPAQLNAMTPADKAKVEEKIRELIKNQEKAQQQAAENPQNPQQIAPPQQAATQTAQQIEQAQQKTTETLQQIQQAQHAARGMPLI
jgi:ABC-type glycerol-3-phosphate transport system substrate-binding protein